MGDDQKFRLERVYHLKAKLTEIEQMKTKYALDARDRTVDALQKKEDKLMSNYRHSLHRARDGCSVRELQGHYEHRVRLQRERHELEIDAEDKEKLLRSHREELLRVRREEQKFENLRRRHFERRSREEKKREQKSIDETANGRYAQRGGDGFDDQGSD
ncbi:MAG: flagellar export protein FliJ [Clostridia bacterium]